MLHFSEYVSIGHPDKIADYISEYLLDRYIERDSYKNNEDKMKNKNTYVTIGGEVLNKIKYIREKS